ncbi:MAG TPA: nuclear transport factor 2 family protein [Candidatus Binatia bacterium]|nr:nuclear transport factor 2 family protein [Candidatus Binatia bacterium]
MTVGGDVAFTRSLNRFGGTTADGTHDASWLCSTLCLRKIDGRWKLVHEHVSVPFDMQTNAALLDLEP